MLENIKKVSNPLTIIAIFSGITEISGTIVLPLVNEASQSIFLWFIMLFPTILVIIFFATLNWNHKVLYAPSDFQDDSSFLAMSDIKNSEIKSTTGSPKNTGISLSGRAIVSGGDK